MLAWARTLLADLRRGRALREVEESGVRWGRSPYFEEPMNWFLVGLPRTFLEGIPEGAGEWNDHGDLWSDGPVGLARLVHIWKRSRKAATEGSKT